MDESEGMKPGALARWWKATWTNLVALAFCIVWLVIVQVVGLFRLIGWLFTLPGWVLFGGRHVPPITPTPPDPSAPPPSRRSTDQQAPPPGRRVWP